MTTQEVFLALVTVSSSVLSLCLWPRSPAQTLTFLELELNGAHKEMLGLLPQLSCTKTQISEMTCCKECTNALSLKKKELNKLNN